MKRTLIACTLALALLAAYAFVAKDRERAVRESVEAKIERLADAVDRLTTLMERVLLEREMADINKVEGDPALNHGVSIPWTTASGQTVLLTVYKNTATETSSELRIRILDATDKWMQVYPPSVGD